MFQGETGGWFSIENHGLKAGTLVFLREVENWLGPVGTESKNGSREVDGLIRLAVNEPRSLVLASTCVFGSWLWSSTDESKKKSRVLGPVAVRSKNASSVV